MSDKDTARATIQTAVVNHKGRVRGNNEDNFYLNGSYMHRGHLDDGASIAGSCKDEAQMYAVCDGMGGTDAGEEASYRAVKSLAGYQTSVSEMWNPEVLTRRFRKISDRIYDEAQDRGQRSGTTIAMVSICGACATVSNVGDSRVYRFRDQSLRQISVDHSKVQRMISMGLLTPEQAKKDPRRHIISQFLGMPKDIRVSPHFEEQIELEKGDLFLLCSDGLTDMVEDAQIEEILKKRPKLEEAAKELLNVAMKNGGKDNTTVMLLRVAGISGSSSANGNTPGALRSVASVLQMVVGAGFFLTLIDFIYYLFRR